MVALNLNCIYFKTCTLLAPWWFWFNPVWYFSNQFNSSFDRVQVNQTSAQPVWCQFRNSTSTTIDGSSCQFLVKLSTSECDFSQNRDVCFYPTLEQPHTSATSNLDKTSPTSSLSHQAAQVLSQHPQRTEQKNQLEDSIVNNVSHHFKHCGI